MKFDKNLNSQILKRMGTLILIKFHPKGESEASICWVTKDSK